MSDETGSVDAPGASSADSDANERPVWGCVDCGVLLDSLPPNGRCDSCGSKLLTELGGAPTPEKAMALMAWARRDATELLEGRGTLVGAGIGALVALVPLAVFAGLRDFGLAVFIYGSAVGALVGNLITLRVHRWLRPKSHLQPIVNARRRRHKLLAAAALAVFPLLVLMILAAMGPGWSVRRGLGALWAVLTGQG